jgi:hypothetical protein
VALGAVSGYAVSDVAYLLDDARVSSVSFTLRPEAASTVRARIGSNWSHCRTRAGRATCTFDAPLPAVEALRTLTVVAAR